MKGTLVSGTALLILLACSDACQHSIDPCISGNHDNLPYTGDRCPACPYTSSTRCDLYDVRDDIWYRADFNMSTDVMQPYKCGAVNPIWLNDYLPGVGEGIVSRTACLVSFTDTCHEEYEVKIKNCGSFQAYCFFDLPSACQQRFCFDYPEATTQSTTVTTKTTTSGEQTAPMIKTTDCDKKRDEYGQKLLLVIVCLSLVSAGLIVTMVVICYDRRRTKSKLDGIMASRISLKTNRSRTSTPPAAFQAWDKKKHPPTDCVFPAGAKKQPLTDCVFPTGAKKQPPTDCVLPTGTMKQPPTDCVFPAPEPAYDMIRPKF